MLTPNDLLQPKGPVDAPVLFPKVDPSKVDETLTEYLSQGYKQALDAGVVDEPSQDNLARAWALYRVYSAVADRMATRPQSASFQDAGSVGYGSEQLRILTNKAQAYLNEYTNLLPAAPANVGRTPLPGTVTIGLDVTW